MKLTWVLFTLLTLSYGCKKEGQGTGHEVSPPSAVATKAAPTELVPAEAAPTEAVRPAIPPAAPGMENSAVNTNAPGKSPRGDVVALGGGGIEKTMPGSDRVVAETEAYQIKLASPQETSKTAQATAMISVVPKAGWHFNKEFPTKVELSGSPNVTVSKPVQSLTDARKVSDDGGMWSFDFMSEEPGEKTFKALLKFAVCTETTCDPKKQEISWAVKVN